MTILGVFIFQTEDVFAKQDGKVRKLLAGVTSLGPTVPAEQLVFVSNHVAKVLEAKSSQFKSVDLRPQDTKLEFVRLEASIILDLPAARTVEEELSDDLVFPIQKMEENLKHCIFVFGNRILADSDVLGKPFEDKKKGKNRNKNESIDEEDEDGTQQVVKVDLLTTGGNIALDTQVL